MELPRVARRPAPHGLLAVAAIGAVLAAVCIVLVDEPVARAAATYEPAAFWAEGLDALEWAIGLPLFRWTSAIVVVLGMAVVVAVPRLRYAAPAWMFVAASHVLGQVATSYIKEWTARMRPDPWLRAGGDTFFREGHAFPSGHVTIFASLIVPLAIVFPRLRPLLAAIAFVMAARVVANAHWVSDVIGGVTLVALVTWACGWAIRPLHR